ncbi:MAG: hypothetical protein ACI9E3_001196, partial [Flavobacteriales bacterium]
MTGLCQQEKNYQKKNTVLLKNGWKNEFWKNKPLYFFVLQITFLSLY